MNPFAVAALFVGVAGLFYFAFRGDGRTRPVSTYQKIWVIGDSIAQGLAAHIPSGFRGLSVTHVGAQMPAVQNEAYSELHDTGIGPDDLLLVNVGTNDVYANLSKGEMQQRVASFLSTLRLIAPASTIIWALPPAAGSSSRYDALRLALLQEGVRTVEMQNATDYLAGDGIHLGPDGYAEYVRQIMEA